MPSPKKQHRGRLELSWTNKDDALLSREDGSYEWVPKRDHRVAEVRLLRDAGTVGEVHAEDKRAKDNLLIRGDALHALTALTSLPEFADEYAGKIRLVYIDPPFNTGQAFTHYDDGLEHSVWLTMMRDRLEQVRKLLSRDGSVWVHLDDAELAYCKVMLDDVFGRDCFVASVVWRSADTGNYDAKQFSEDHNTMLVYSAEPGWRSRRVGRSEQQSSHFSNPDGDPRGPWFDGNPLGSPNPRDNLKFDLVSPQGHTIKHPPNGWRWSRPTLDEKLGTGEIRFSEDGKRIIYRTYLADMDDLPPSTLWDSTADTGSNRKAKNELKRLFKLRASEVFDTPKPEALMAKVLTIATDRGDIVLDCFGGSGTTAAVAHKMGRRWITAELSRSTIETFTAPRLRAVVTGDDGIGVTSKTTRVAVQTLPDGVSAEQAYAFTSLLRQFTAHLDEAFAEQAKDDAPEGSEQGAETEDGDVAERDLAQEAIEGYLAALRTAASTRKVTTKEWSGGGGFRVLDVAPSMYDEDEGLVVLAEDAQGGTLAEQVAAQLGFAYEPEPPFCGTHGRMRLAVIDGHVDEAAVRLLVRALPDGQRLSLAATSLDPEAAELLAKIKPGSAARVVPQDILLAYRTPSAWRAAVTKEIPQDEEAADETPKTEPMAPEPVGDTT